MERLWSPIKIGRLFLSALAAPATSPFRFPSLGPPSGRWLYYLSIPLSFRRSHLSLSPLPRASIHPLSFGPPSPVHAGLWRGKKKTAGCPLSDYIVTRQPWRRYATELPCGEGHPSFPLHSYAGLFSFLVSLWSPKRYFPLPSYYFPVFTLRLVSSAKFFGSSSGECSTYRLAARQSPHINSNRATDWAVSHKEVTRGGKGAAAKQKKILFPGAGGTW